MRWQEKHAAACSPCVARMGGQLRPGNFGRGSLASSHAGTRLPIAAGTPPGRDPPMFPARTQGAPPPSAPGSWGRAPVCGFSALPSFVKNFQKARRRRASRAPPSKVLYRLPTAALPASGKGSKPALPLSLSAPLLFGVMIPPGKKFVKGLAKRGEKAYDKGIIKGESAGAG